MRNVALHLANEALTRTQQGGPDADMFARCAYSRYYYDVFLQTRSLLVQLRVIQPADEVAHVGLPEQLRASVQRSLMRALNRAWQKGSIDPQLYRHLDATLKRAIVELSRLLDLSRTIRVIADYWLETKVHLTTHRFSLQNVGNAEANQWPLQAQRFTSAIKDGWIQLGSPQL